MMERDWAEDSMGQQHVPQEDIRRIVEIVLCMQQRRNCWTSSINPSALEGTSSKARKITVCGEEKNKKRQVLNAKDQ